MLPSHHPHHGVLLLIRRTISDAIIVSRPAGGFYPGNGGGDGRLPGLPIKIDPSMGRRGVVPFVPPGGPTRSTSTGRVAITPPPGYIPPVFTSTGQVIGPDSVGFPPIASIDFSLPQHQQLKEYIARKAVADASAAAQRPPAPSPVNNARGDGVDGEAAIRVTIIPERRIRNVAGGFGQDIYDLGMEYIRQQILPPTDPMIVSGAGPPYTLPFSAIDVGGTTIPSTYYAPKKKRRRRRRLLTPTDFSDLAALKTLTGNNDAFKFAVLKAVRR